MMKFSQWDIGGCGCPPTNNPCIGCITPDDMLLTWSGYGCTVASCTDNNLGVGNPFFIGAAGWSVQFSCDSNHQMYMQWTVSTTGNTWYSPHAGVTPGGPHETLRINAASCTPYGISFSGTVEGQQTSGTVTAA